MPRSFLVRAHTTLIPYPIAYPVPFFAHLTRLAAVSAYASYAILSHFLGRRQAPQHASRDCTRLSSTLAPISVDLLDLHVVGDVGPWEVRVARAVLRVAEMAEAEVSVTTELAHRRGVVGRPDGLDGGVAVVLDKLAAGAVRVRRSAQPDGGEAVRVR